jgi:3-oxoacyl-[acyl-carrier-protein] synthase-3
VNKKKKNTFWGLLNNLRFAIGQYRILKNLRYDWLSRGESIYQSSKYGNTSAASIPIALDEEHRQGRVNRGDLILLCTFGGGLTWGSLLLRW